MDKEENAQGGERVKNKPDEIEDSEGRKRILWLSRHSPQDRQIKELKQIFGDVEIVQVAETVKGGEEVIELMNENNCDELVAVLPINLLAQVIGRGVKPIRAVMEREVVNEEEVIFMHSHFERVLEISVKTRNLLEQEEGEAKEEENTIVTVGQLKDARDEDYARSCVYGTYRAKGYSPSDAKKKAKEVMKEAEL